MYSISLIIKELRKQKKLSQKELAEHLGVEHQTISKWETGETSPRPKQLPRLAEILGVPLESFSGNVSKVQTNVNIHYLPYLSARATASFLDRFGQEGYFVGERYPVYFSAGEIPKENQMVIDIDGDSMEPTIKSHSKILIEELPLGDVIYMNSGIYAVVFDSQFVVKRVKENEVMSKGILTLYSDNLNSGFIAIRKEDIRAVWKAIKIVEQKL